MRVLLQLWVGQSPDDLSLQSITRYEMLHRASDLGGLYNRIQLPSAAKQRLGKHVSTEMQFLDKQSVAR
jgi:hypothetical protein